MTAKICWKESIANGCAPHSSILSWRRTYHDILTRPPARREELFAELGHPGDRVNETFFWDTEPLHVPLRHTPDPVTFGLALAPATGFFDHDGPIALPMRPDDRAYS